MADEHASATELLLRAGAGESSATASVFPPVYDELRRIAHLRLAKEPSGRTLGTTELVHEALPAADRSDARLMERPHAFHGGRGDRHAIHPRRPRALLARALRAQAQAAAAREAGSRATVALTSGYGMSSPWARQARALVDSLSR